MVTLRGLTRNLLAKAPGSSQEWAAVIQRASFFASASNCESENVFKSVVRSLIAFTKSGFLGRANWRCNANRARSFYWSPLANSQFQHHSNYQDGRVRLRLCFYSHLRSQLHSALRSTSVSRFSDHRMQHFLVQRQVRYQLLQPCVLVSRAERPCALSPSLSHASAPGPLYNSSTGTFTPTGNLNTGRADFTATLLNDGQVLIAGGDAYVFMVSGTQHFCFANAELYNPATGTFTLTGSMHAQRCGGSYPQFTATLLGNGMVLIVGGGNSSGLVSAADLYDPSNGTFSVTGSLNTLRFGHTATLLPTGEVLIAGGINSAGQYLASAELYNPSTGTFTPTGSMKTTRELATATLLGNGEVLVAGGEHSNLVFPYISEAELYNPSTGKWTTTGSLNTGRFDHTATLLNNGQVLIAAGAPILASAELYDPSTGKFSVTGSLNTGRRLHTATLLTNGEVLVTGGYDGSGGNIGYLSSAELFH